MVFLSPAAPIAAAQRKHTNHEIVVRFDVEPRQVGSDGLCHIVRRQMSVVLLRHTGIGVAKLLGDDSHRNSTHGQVRSVRVSQHMEGYGRRYSSLSAGMLKGAVLLGRSPHRAIGSMKKIFVGSFVSSPL